MKRKSLILTLLILLMLSIINMSAEEISREQVTFNKAKSTSLTGTTATHVGELVISRFSFTSIGVDNITGTITYDKNVLALFRVDVDESFASNTTIDTKTAGKIKFEVTNKDSNIANSYSKDDVPLEHSLLTITFVVINPSSSNTVITAQNVASSITNTFKVKERICTNQSEIDDAMVQQELDPQFPTPDPIYEEKESEIQEKENFKYADVNQSVKVSKSISDDAYLKSLEVEGGVLTPTFSKGVNAYKVTIDSKKELNIHCVCEDSKASVVIQDEVNNQVVITVTAENETNSNTYVLTIDRQENYSPSNPTNPTTPVNPSTPTNPATPTSNGLDTMTIIIASVGALLALIGFVGGGILINKGAHNQ